MERYEVLITDEALADMEEIYRYIAVNLRARSNALGQCDRIAGEILSLEVLPLRYPVVQFEPERSAGLRRLRVDNYSVFYVVRGEQVSITSVLYSASDIEERLREEQ